MSDGVVRWPDRPVTPGRVAVITVSYNTRELTALLLWSLRRILAWGSLEIVVVDNGSTDGSAELLAKVDAAGGCRLIANADNAMHGPALTQAMSFLASRRTELPRWVWALDSDVVISRPNALEQALRCAEETNAAVVGESWWDDEHGMDRFLAYSLLLERSGEAGQVPDPVCLLVESEAQGLPVDHHSVVEDGQIAVALVRGKQCRAEICETGCQFDVAIWRTSHRGSMSADGLVECVWQVALLVRMKQDDAEIRQVHRGIRVTRAARGNGLLVGRHCVVQHFLVLIPHGLLVKRRSQVGQPTR